MRECGSEERIRQIVARGIRRAVEGSGLTVAEAAERVGVSRKTISNWMSGRATPRLGGFAKLCDALEPVVLRAAGSDARPRPAGTQGPGKADRVSGEASDATLEADGAVDELKESYPDISSVDDVDPEAGRAADVDLDAARAQAADLFEAGVGFKAVAARLGVPHDTVREWACKYRSLGREELCAPRRIRRSYAPELKLAAARAHVEEGLSAAEVMERFGVANRRQIKDWSALYKRDGVAAFGRGGEGGES